MHKKARRICQTSPVPMPVTPVTPGTLAFGIYLAWTWGQPRSLIGERWPAQTVRRCLGLAVMASPERVWEAPRLHFCHNKSSRARSSGGLLSKGDSVCHYYIRVCRQRLSATAAKTPRLDTEAYAYAYWSAYYCPGVRHEPTVLWSASERTPKARYSIAWHNATRFGRWNGGCRSWLSPRTLSCHCLICPEAISPLRARSKRNTEYDAHARERASQTCLRSKT